MSNSLQRLEKIFSLFNDKYNVIKMCKCNIIDNGLNKLFSAAVCHGKICKYQLSQSYSVIILTNQLYLAALLL